MTTQIKYLAFIGIEKKEQILFKSFLNLAKNELEYQVVILKSDHEDEPDMLILGEDHMFDEAEQHLQSLPTILVGDDDDNVNENYVRRPVQWSDFKHALSQLDVTVTDDDQAVERVLPDSIDFAINANTESSLYVDESDSDQDDIEKSSDSDEEDYQYELGKISIDYNSFTNSDYVQVVDDVRKFNQQDDEVSSNEPVVLITDEESAAANSVLIIETDSHEAWDFSQSETTTISQINKEVDDTDDDDEEEVVLEQKVGLQMQPNEEYWLADNEIIVDHQTLFYIKTERGMIYSTREPGHWPQILQEGTLSKLPMPGNWQPKGGYKAYPLNCLLWTNALIFESEELAPGLDSKASYILDKWPQFDLIELDNSLLRLCTMLFVRPETVESLMTKSGYGRSVVVGLLNACDSIDLLKSSDDFDQEHSISIMSTEGVFDKIKDVFR